MKKIMNVSDVDLKSVVENVARTGQEVVVGQDDKPLVRIVPVLSDEKENAGRSRRLGRFAGQIKVSDDFDEWTEEEARALGIID